MPYINKNQRVVYDNLIMEIVSKISNSEVKPFPAGDLNYIISRIIWDIFRKNKSYTVGNNLVGVLECVKQEFYRKQLAIYEDQKEKEQGEI